MATTNTTSKTSNTAKQHQVFLFDKSNYMWMLIGVAFVLLGLVLMAGGKSEDPNVFNYDELYSFRRITLAPVLMMIGFGIEVYAIMKKPKDADKVD